jgi:hypothetical protein
MSAVNLTKEQKANIKKFIRAFEQYLKSQEFQRDQAEIEKRTQYFQAVLPEKLPELSELDVQEIVSNLWASKMFANKATLSAKLVRENGIEKLKTAFRNLFDKDVPPHKRYEKFLKEIKGFGAASVTEMLSYIEPERCGIWNEKTRCAIKKLNLGDIVNPKKYELTGSEYEVYNQLIRAVSEELKHLLKKRTMDLLFAHLFFYEVCEAEVLVCGEDFDHNEIRDMVYEIGSMLGFDVDKEVPIGHGARVDVVWRARIGNLGTVTYVFEVHKSGSIDSLLLNLQKALRNPTVQKVVAISSPDRLEQIKNEAEGLPSEFQRNLSYWDVKEVCDTIHHLQSISKIIEKLGLVGG